MPSLWLFNMEEESSQAHPTDACLINKNARVANSRNLFNMHQDDIAIIAEPVDLDFNAEDGTLRGALKLDYSTGMQ